MNLSDATKRALRTLLHALLGAPAALALIPADSPYAARLGGVAAAVAAVSAVINKLEDAGILPAWLKPSA